MLFDVYMEWAGELHFETPKYLQLASFAFSFCKSPAVNPQNKYHFDLNIYAHNSQLCFKCDSFKIKEVGLIRIVIYS